MIRRALQAPSTLSGVRKFTDYQHMKYPIDPTYAYGVPLYFTFFWLLWFRMGSVFTKRSEYKNDYLRTWKRKLGTGYAWADAWGPQKETLFRNLPTSTK